VLTSTARETLPGPRTGGEGIDQLASVAEGGAVTRSESQRSIAQRRQLATPVLRRRTRDALFAMPTAWHHGRLVSAITTPGKPDGEVIAGPLPTSTFELSLGSSTARLH
jgi:hypothetical protein